MGMVPGEAGLEVLYMDDILSDQDLATITSICPTYNLLPEDEAAALELIEGQEVDTEASSTASSSDTTHRGTAAEVMATEQKGMGLKVLKKQLSLFSEIPNGFDISALSLAERKEIQARLENDCVDAAVSRWREENESLQKMGLNTSVASSTLSSKLYEWHLAMETRLAKEFEAIDLAEETLKKSKEDMDRCMYGPFLRQSTPTRLSAVTILSTLSSLAMHGADKGVPLSTMVQQLSKIAEEDIRTQAKSMSKNSNKKTVQMNVKRLLKFSPERSASNKTEADHVDMAPASEISHPPTSSAEEAVAETYAESAWPTSIRTKVGAALLMALIDSAKMLVQREHPVTREPIAQIQPAFSHASHLRKGKKIGMIMPNRALVEIMKREPRGAYIARHLPMVVEPEPWTKFDKGGFIEVPSALVRIKAGEKDQRVYTEAAIARGDMDQILKGLDVLGRTAWRINRPVYEVMLEAWNSGVSVGDIPAADPQIPIPPEPRSDDPMEQRKWLRMVKSIENEKSGLHSVRCFMNFQLEISRAFRDQTFYFPHNVDFRGRAYPIPTYLNHMGADHVRGLLVFAKGRELGESGLRWLKVHLANVYGYDKASLADRESFAGKNMENIVDSVTNPLNGRRWWLEAEDPWQTLATCYELKAAMDLPDPTKFVSHLPIHQDGTCNGLQHYAALGGDEWGARQVNLVPGDKPADVYSAVADLVNESVELDKQAGNPFADALSGKITRKVVKQTVMTNVYGVTFSGAKKQVQKQIDSLYPNIHKETGLEPVLLASYVAMKIFKALGSMFKGAHDIQHWLGEIGGRVCRALTPEQLELIAAEEPRKKGRKTLEDQKKVTKKVLKADATKTSTGELVDKFKSTLIWTTPLRMPIVQPYKKSTTRTISTCLQDLILTIPDRSDPVHRRKQLQAFPPNFIHSLDASHMLLSALECDEKGLTFAAVHDSFWTHAADVDVMNEVLRDAFIRIHSEDVIGRLAAEFEARYKGCIYLAKIHQGSPAAKAIHELRKKQKLSLRGELIAEKTRLDLLNSDNPEDVEEGKQMVTSASIYEQLSGAGDLVMPDEANETTLGVVPASEEKAVATLAEISTPEKMAEEGQAYLETVRSHMDVGEAMEDDHAESESESDRDSSDLPENTEKLVDMIGTSDFVVQTQSVIRLKKQSKRVPYIEFWLPLTFPKIPEKGGFDVRALKGSKYFFS